MKEADNKSKISSHSSAIRHAVMQIGSEGAIQTNYSEIAKLGEELLGEEITFNTIYHVLRSDFTGQFYIRGEDVNIKFKPFHPDVSPHISSSTGQRVSGPNSVAPGSSYRNNKYISGSSKK